MKNPKYESKRNEDTSLGIFRHYQIELWAIFYKNIRWDGEVCEDCIFIMFKPKNVFSGYIIILFKSLKWQSPKNVGKPDKYQDMNYSSLFACQNIEHKPIADNMENVTILKEWLATVFEIHDSFKLGYSNKSEFQLKRILNMEGEKKVK